MCRVTPHWGIGVSHSHLVSVRASFSFDGLSMMSRACDQHCGLPRLPVTNQHMMAHLGHGSPWSLYSTAPQNILLCWLDYSKQKWWVVRWRQPYLWEFVLWKHHQLQQLLKKRRNGGIGLSLVSSSRGSGPQTMRYSSSFLPGPKQTAECSH